MLAEKVGSNTTRRYVWSPVYVDAMVLRDRDTDADGTLEERLWVQQDANWNVTALVDGSGAVVERYVYDPFGVQTVLNASYVGIGSSAYSWSYYHQGLRWDDTATQYDNFGRWYSPTLGRFTSVDPVRFAGGDVNLYRYVGNGPANRLDPSGLSWLSRQWEGSYGQAAAQGVGEGAGNLARGAKNAAVELGQSARDVGNTVISAGSHITDGAFGTGVYSYDLHSQTFGGYDRAVKNGTGDSYTLNAMANGASFGVKPLVEGVHGYYQNPTAETAANASQTAGGVAFGNLTAAGSLRLFGPAWANEPITVGRVGRTRPSFSSMMEASEAARYARYWQTFEAPTHMPPTGSIRRLADYVPSSTAPHSPYWRIAYYDEFGRLVGRTDIGHHGFPDAHPVPHHHIYDPMYRGHHPFEVPNPGAVRPMAPRVWPGFHPLEQHPIVCFP